MGRININGKILNFTEVGSGAPVILIHGFPVDHTVWLPFADAIKHSYRCILPDLPGFGASELLAGQGSMHAYADAIIGLIECLGVGMVEVVGHSMGGYVALELAHSHPSVVSRLHLVGSQVFADTDEARSRRASQVLEIGKVGLQPLYGMAERLVNDPKHTPALLQLIQQQSAAGAIFALQAMASRADHSKPDMHQNKPVTIYHGDADPLVPIERAEAALACDPQAVLVRFQGVGHSPMIEDPLGSATAFLNQKRGA